MQFGDNFMWPMCSSYFRNPENSGVTQADASFLQLQSKHTGQKPRVKNISPNCRSENNFIHLHCNLQYVSSHLVFSCQSRGVNVQSNQVSHLLAPEKHLEKHLKYDPVVYNEFQSLICGESQWRELGTSKRWFGSLFGRGFWNRWGGSPSAGP